MRTAFTIGYDRAGNPEVLADCRTPIQQQRQSMAMLKAGITQPGADHARIELWESERGVTRIWVGMKPQAALTQTTEDKPKKKGSK